MNSGRRFQRYAVDQGVKTPDQLEIIVGKEVVRLVDFSVGGFYILSELRLSPGEVNISVNFGNHGKMDLTGRIIRVKKEGDMWGVAIDLSKNYKLESLKKV